MNEQYSTYSTMLNIPHSSPKEGDEYHIHHSWGWWISYSSPLRVMNIIFITLERAKVMNVEISSLPSTFWRNIHHLKSVRETRFWPFLDFFLRALFAFHVRNFSIFGHISRPLFLFFCTGTFLHFFHGSKVRFHGRRFKGIYSFSPLNFVELLTGIDFVFTGGILQKFSRVYFLFRTFWGIFIFFTHTIFFTGTFSHFYHGCIFFSEEKNTEFPISKKSYKWGKIQNRSYKSSWNCSLEWAICAAFYCM